MEKVKQILDQKDDTFKGKNGESIDTTKYDIIFESSAYPHTYTTKRGAEAPKVGDELDVELLEKNGFRYAKKKQSGYQNRQKQSGSSYDTGLQAAIAGYSAAAHLYGKAISGTDAEEYLKFCDLAKALTIAIRKESDYRITQAQRKKIFYIFDHYELPENVMTRDDFESLDKAGKVTKAVASNFIEATKDAKEKPAKATKAEEKLDDIPF